ncbi:Rrf2 family transcriptional regulator [Brucepastera parasyntrophica]|uniref:Rrf2 family transcriptional regulator n=1 Tax=Brucepastera parasyntrophica TaxID=2880008 RepID=UPI002108BACA|nr:Rrf2 family transcriptional regulator [Brucepastera parasyntrophica]ULQ60983.1 Rrf2 family transcriptional regulator [Brucepastera parasyntrophica]
MQIGTKFSIAIHILLSAEVFKETHKVTSDFIASSANTNPVIIRNIMGMLKEAGIIEVAAGTGGITLTRKPKDISLKDIYLAIDPVKDGRLFKIHQNTEPNCPVGGNIERILNPYFFKAQNAMENELGKYNLKNLLDDLKQ